MTLTQKSVFLSLNPRDRKKIQVLIAVIASLQALEFLIGGHRVIAPLPAILGNLVLLYWSAAPQKAWNWFFTFIPYICVISLVFDCLALYRAWAGEPILASSVVVIGIRLAVLAFSAPAVVGYQIEVRKQLARDRESTSGTDQAS
ncbi:MAG TPA: hypothetical protein VKB50_25670 [Vicinamibacterales bacterium]|nr:hypothetical protein [Vicinamibacterales bacterium]